MQQTITLEKRSKPQLKGELAFLTVHLIPLLMIFTGATLFDWAVLVVLYFIRMFFITAGYHRYFAHKSYKTSRWFQFFLAFMAMTSAQKGVLWWGAHHRTHHKYSDTPKDPHSMKLYGFWYSHVGWIITPDYNETRYDLIKDMAKYPELVWLDKYYLVPPVVMGFLVTMLGGYVNGGSIATIFTHGWSTLVVGFFLSTVILYHGTFSINSIMHKFGKKRYDSKDESKNSLWLALLTLGEGWHNNHHYYQAASRCGFYWWEVDPTYYGLKLFSWLGLVWDLKQVPRHIRDTRTRAQAKAMFEQKGESPDDKESPAIRKKTGSSIKPRSLPDAV